MKKQSRGMHYLQWSFAGYAPPGRMGLDRFRQSSFNFEEGLDLEVSLSKPKINQKKKKKKQKKKGWYLPVRKRSKW